MIPCTCPCHSGTSLEECFCCEGMCSNCRQCFTSGLKEHCESCGGFASVDLNLLDRLRQSHDNYVERCRKDNVKAWWEDEYTGDGV